MYCTTLWYNVNQYSKGRGNYSGVLFCTTKPMNQWDKQEIRLYKYISVFFGPTCLVTSTVRQGIITKVDHEGITALVGHFSEGYLYWWASTSEDNLYIDGKVQGLNYSSEPVRRGIITLIKQYNKD